jgi:hypothetical protein
MRGWDGRAAAPGAAEVSRRRLARAEESAEFGRNEGRTKSKQAARRQHSHSPTRKNIKEYNVSTRFQIDERPGEYTSGIYEYTTSVCESTTNVYEVATDVYRKILDKRL